MPVRKEAMIRGPRPGIVCDCGTSRTNGPHAIQATNTPGTPLKVYRNALDRKSAPNKEVQRG